MYTITCTCCINWNNVSMCCGENLEAAYAKILWMFSTWAGFLSTWNHTHWLSRPLKTTPTCISHMVLSSSVERSVPKNSTIDFTLSQYWAWWRLPNEEEKGGRGGKRGKKREREKETQRENDKERKGFKNQFQVFWTNLQRQWIGPYSLWASSSPDQPVLGSWDRYEQANRVLQSA